MPQSCVQAPPPLRYARDMIRPPAFRLNGNDTALADCEPTQSLLRWLNGQGWQGTKEGCADGDCGACTVALLEQGRDGSRQVRAVNSCLLPLGCLPGREVITVEHLADGDVLHPVQQAMVDCHASQCGYCTPGFVMSLYAGWHEGKLDDHTIEGNLCRCTGYLPMRRAMQRLCEQPASHVDLALGSSPPMLAERTDPCGRFFNPVDLADALRLKQEHGDAQWFAGGTDLGVELSRGKNTEGVFIALDRIAELQHLHIGAERVSIGAGVSLRRLEAELAQALPALVQMLRVFAARQVKNRATLGGNLGTASPIGDLLPVLLALDADIELLGPNGARTVATLEFFLDYRRTVRHADELVLAVHVPLAKHPSASYKVAKRPSDDISIVAACFALALDPARRVSHVRMAFGGVAAIPCRARKTEEFLLGRMLDADCLAEATRMLREEFTPLSDHRGSADYRRELCASLFARFIDEQFS